MIKSYKYNSIKNKESLRYKFFRLVEPTKDTSNSNYYFDLFILSLILLNVLAIMLSTVPGIGIKYQKEFYFFELFSVSIFSIEYLIRIWTIVEKEKFSHPIFGRIRYAFTFLGLIDLLAVLPFYLPFVFVDLRFIRIIRIFRIFRLFKLLKYSKALMLIKSVLKEKKEELVITLMFAILILVLISSLMYFVERDAQPKLFGSIPQALWWGVVTLTTIGYGDVYPITITGKILGGIINLLSIGIIALPSGILASGYTEHLQKRKKVEE